MPSDVVSRPSYSSPLATVSARVVPLKAARVGHEHGTALRTRGAGWPRPWRNGQGQPHSPTPQGLSARWRSRSGPRPGSPASSHRGCRSTRAVRPLFGQTSAGLEPTGNRPHGQGRPADLLVGHRRLEVVLCALRAGVVPVKPEQ
jgi:hypothetical protein